MSRTWKPTGPAARRLPPTRASAGRGSFIARVVRAWRILPPERRLAATAAIGLFLTLFLNWYQETVIAGGGHGTATLRSASVSLTGWQAFSFVEAAVLLVAIGVLVLLFTRAEGRAFHVPGGDGGVITAAGLWTCALVVWRIFDKEGTTGHQEFATTSGIDWGIFVALGVAGLLTYAGSRIRRAADPEPPLPGDLDPIADVEDGPVGRPARAAAPTRRASARRTPTRRARAASSADARETSPSDAHETESTHRERDVPAAGSRDAGRTGRRRRPPEARSRDRGRPAPPTWDDLTEPVAEPTGIVRNPDRTRETLPMRDTPATPGADEAPDGGETRETAAHDAPVTAAARAHVHDEPDEPEPTPRRRARALSRHEAQEIEIAEPPPSTLRRARPAPYRRPSDLGAGEERTGDPGLDDGAPGDQPAAPDHPPRGRDD